jgi:hypothetical protein
MQKDIKRSSISMSSISAADDSCPGLESEWPPSSTFAFSLTSSVNSQTKTSKVRDDKLEAAITSPRLKDEGRIVDIIGLEERALCPCWVIGSA